MAIEDFGSGLLNATFGNAVAPRRQRTGLVSRVTKKGRTGVTEALGMAFQVMPLLNPTVDIPNFWCVALFALRRFFFLLKKGRFKTRLGETTHQRGPSLWRPKEMIMCMQVPLKKGRELGASDYCLFFGKATIRWWSNLGYSERWMRDFRPQKRSESEKKVWVFSY